MKPTEKQLANLRPARKGEVRNPTGTNGMGVPKAIRKMTASELGEIMLLILDKNLHQLKKIVEDAKANPSSQHSSLRVWMAMVAVKGMSKGDAHALDILLNRIVGKPKETLELTSSVDVNINPQDIDRQTREILERVAARNVVTVEGPLENTLVPDQESSDAAAGAG